MVFVWIDRLEMFDHFILGKLVVDHTFRIHRIYSSPRSLSAHSSARSPCKSRNTPTGSTPSSAPESKTPTAPRVHSSTSSSAAESPASAPNSPGIAARRSNRLSAARPASKASRTALQLARRARRRSRSFELRVLSRPIRRTSTTQKAE